MNDIVGVGIVGTGAIFRDHFVGCQSLPALCRVVGIAEVDERRRTAATERYFIPFACEDYRELLQRHDVDVVNVCTPPHLHEEIVIAALQAGKYVVCEKPLAHTLEAADRIVEASQQSPGKLSTVFQLRYVSEFQRLLWLQEQGALGELLFGRFVRSDRAAGYPGVSDGRWGRWKQTGGGVIITQFIHQLDLMCRLFGQPVQVSAEMATMMLPIESEDVFAGVVQFANGARVMCSSNGVAQLYENRIDVFGSEGSAHFPWRLEINDAYRKSDVQKQLERALPDKAKRPKKTLAARAKRRILRQLGWGGKGTVPNQHAGLFRQIFEAVKSGKPVPVPPDESRSVLELCTAIYTAAIQRRPVNLPLDRTTPFYRGVTAKAYDRIRNPSETNQPVKG